MTLISVDKAIRTIMGFGDIPQDNGLAYVRVQRILMPTVGELNLNVSPKIISFIGTIASDYTIDLPADSVKAYKVGRLLDNGEIRTLGKIKTYVSSETECDCPGCEGTSVLGQSTEEASTDASYCSLCTFHNFLFNNGSYGELYAARNDYFENGNWSEEDGKVKFHSGYDVSIGNQMVVEYESAFNEEGLSLIPFDEFEMIRNKVLSEFFKTSKPSLAVMYHRDFKVAIANRKRRLTRMPHEEWIAALTGYKNVP